MKWFTVHNFFNKLKFNLKIPKCKFLKTSFIAISLWLVFAQPGFSNNNTALFNRANEFFRKEQYDTSILLYESILKSGYHAPEVYYNLGNAYYRKKNIAAAILNYERAYKLDPGNSNIKFNLQLAQTMIVDKINSVQEFFLKHWWRVFSQQFSSDGWASVSILSFLITLILATVYLFTVQLWLKKLSFWLGILAIFVSIICFINSYDLKSERLERKTAIVMSPSVTIKSSPDETGTDLFVIHEGLKVWIIDKVDTWSKIKIADGSSGWLKDTDIEPI